MYEPYGEEGKIKFDFSGFKEKLKEKLKTLRTSKWALVIIAIVALGLAGGYTGWTTYTTRINEFNSRIMILEKQMEACQGNLSSCFFNLDATSNELSSTIFLKEECESNFKTTQTELNSCLLEKESAKGEASVVKSDLDTCIADLEQKINEYDDLKRDVEDLECGFAKKICGTAGMNYYFIKNKEVICCLKEDASYCSETPDSEDDIKKINC